MEARVQPLPLTERVLAVSECETDAALAEELARRRLGLTPTEARKIAAALGRDPTLVEAYIFDIEWSEHCSYKSSKKVLGKYLPTEAPNVMLGVGEDAGIVELADVGGARWGLVMGHESHNHPSQVLPVEGAATGVGGIVRDVDCMGARVIAVADSLRFGDPEGGNRQRTKWIAGGVVDGIWEYGNALGVPNLGGEVYFDPCFDDNCLVVVVALGVVREDWIIHSACAAKAGEEGHDLIIIGKPTDNSGFGGVTFASEILDEAKDSESRGAVQVHDPFLKNVLLMRKANEAVRELAREKGAAIGFKDLGGGGFACGSSEIADAGGCGVCIDLDLVPQAFADLLPEEIAIAETQERYVLTCPKWFTPDVLRIYNEEWDLPGIYEGAAAAVVGTITTERRYVVIHKGETVVDAPIEEITRGITYDR